MAKTQYKDLFEKRLFVGEDGKQTILFRVFNSDRDKTPRVVIKTQFWDITSDRYDDPIRGGKSVDYATLASALQNGLLAEADEAVAQENRQERVDEIGRIPPALLADLRGRGMSDDEIISKYLQPASD